MPEVKKGAVMSSGLRKDDEIAAKAAEPDAGGERNVAFVQPVPPVVAQNDEDVNSFRVRSIVDDGRYFPNVFKQHPLTINDDLSNSFEVGDSIYCTHTKNHFFVISKKQAEAGMVLGNKRFPVNANLLEILAE